MQIVILTDIKSVYFLIFYIYICIYICSLFFLVPCCQDQPTVERGQLYSTKTYSVVNSKRSTLEKGDVHQTHTTRANVLAVVLHGRHVNELLDLYSESIDKKLQRVVGKLISRFTEYLLQYLALYLWYEVNRMLQSSKI